MKNKFENNFVSISTYDFVNVKEIGSIENFKIIFSPKYLKSKSKQPRVVKVKIK
jgi:hypothetical protein